MNEPRVYAVHLALPPRLFEYWYIYNREKPFAWNRKMLGHSFLDTLHIPACIFVHLGLSDSFLLTNLYVGRSVTRLRPHI